MKLRVKTCCGCCDLHTGTLIVGICEILFSLAGIFLYSTETDEVEDDTMKQHYKVGVWFSYTNVVISSLLIYGTIKESRYFLLPWLVHDAIGLGVFTCFCLVLMFYAPVIIILLLITAPLWYIWLCVLSYYHELNPTHLPMHTGGNQTAPMPLNSVSFAPQPPVYVEVIKGPQAV